MSGRQQQERQPSRRRGRATPSPQLYQPRQRPEQAPDGSSGAGRQPQAQPSLRSAATSFNPGPAGAELQSVPSAALPSIEQLLAAAADARQPPAARAAALQHLHQRLFDPAVQRQALQQLQSLWPGLLALLWEDPSSAVTAAAAPAVGAIGALAAQASAAAAAARAASGAVPQAGGSAAAPSAAGLLFDWLLPALQRRVTPSGHPLEPHQLSAVLLALRDCLTGVDAATLARFAEPSLAACQALLESEATPPAALPPLLAALQQAARHQPSLKARFQDLTDLLLGWALEPALPDAARPALARTMAAFGPQWRQQPAFTGSLLNSLLADMARLASKAAEEAAPHEAAAAAQAGAAAEAAAAAAAPPASTTSPSLHQVLALAACMLPMLDAAAALRLPAAQRLLLGFLEACGQAAAAAAAAGAASPAAATAATVELASHVARLAALAPAAAAASLPGGGTSAEAQQGDAAGACERVAVQLVARLGLADQLTPAAELVELRFSIQPAAAAAAGEPAGAAAAAGERAAALLGSLQQLFAAVAAFSAAAAGSPATLAQPSTVLALLATVRSWAQVLVHHAQLAAGGTAVQLVEAAEVLLAAGGGGSWLLGLRGYGSSDVLLQAAQLLGVLLPHSQAAVQALLADCMAQAQAVSSSTDSLPAAALRFNLHLLQAAVPRLPADSLRAVWQQLLPAAAAGGPFALAEQQPQAPRLWQLWLALLQAAGRRLADSQQLGAAAAADAALTYLSGVLASSATPEPVLLQALRMMQQAAGWPAAAAEQHAPAQALQAALQCVEAEVPAVRVAALAAAQALAASTRGGALLLREPVLAAGVYQSALLHLSDMHPPAAEAAQQLLATAAAPLAVCGALAAHSSSSSGCAAAAAEAAAAALGAQRLGMRPAQLQQWLNFLSSPAAPAAAAGERQAAPLQQWLPRLLHSMQAAPLPGGDTQASAPKALSPWHLPSSVSLAAWWATQEAAKQCVAARLRTHHGGPSQTLAAFERALQAAVAQLQSNSLADGQAEAAAGGAPPAAGGESRRQVTALLLIFLHALEQGIAGAGRGCTSRAAAPQSAVSFFAANDKVCRSWFARVRLALLRASTAAQLHELAAHHALQRLRDLEQQVPALLPTPAPPAAADSPVAAQRGSQDGSVGAGTPASTRGLAAAAASERTPLDSRQPGGAAAAGSDAAANSAAALLAATKGSPDVAQRLQQLEPGSPAEAAQRAQQAAAKVAEAAAAAAAALCALSDADGVAGLQAYCQRAFGPLLEHLHHRQQAAGSGTSANNGDDAEAAAAGEAAWQWLAAVQLQAAGQYEAALVQYARLYDAPGANSVQCAPASAVARLAAQAYTAVGDAPGLERWLQTKLGGRLPQAAAARCLQLARWDPEVAGHPQQQATSGDGCQLASGLRLASLDPGATSDGGSASLAAVAARLAEIAAAGGAAKRLPANLLLAEAEQGLQHQPFSAWQPPTRGSASALRSEAAPASLQALLTLSSTAAGSAGQQGPLLLAAAQAAAAGGNASCAQRLLARAESALATADGSRGGSSEAHRLLLRLQHLQAAGAAAPGCARQAWQLMVAASSSAAAAAVVPGAARLLLSPSQQPARILAAEVAAVMDATPSVLGSGAVAQLERLLLAEQQQQLGAPAPAAAVQYAALKAAVAAAPGSARQWRLWASRLHQLAEEQPVAQPAAFAASCRALALAATGGTGSGVGALPLLLQLLQLLVSPSALPADAADQLAAVPAAAWLPLVPQLVSHLAAGCGGDGGSSLQQQGLLLGLAACIGGAAPCQVLLPALVASAQPPAAAGQQPAPVLQLVQRLQQRHPRLAAQLRVLTAEAARLAVLPEEHWQAVLQEAAATASKRLQAQQRQRRRTSEAEGGGAAAAADDSDSGASYLAALTPVLLLLEQQVQAAEAAAPQTPHEQHFRQQHLPRLRQLVQHLMAPLAAGSQQQQQQAAQRQSPVALLRAAAAELAAALRVRQLSLADVAPALAELADTGIPIPGVPATPGSSSTAGGPTLAGVAGEATVLATKTRPKRLRFLASDGSEHAFLLKGREDLRAEARLMQLLRACGAALQAPAAGGAVSPAGASLAVHGFEVTPLGSRVGLVQWVEGSVPLYELYTSWQQHHAQRQRLLAAAAAAQQAAAGAAVGTPRAANAAAAQQQAQQQLMRPVELFVTKLREAGIDPAAPRDSWPLAKLVAAFEGMQQMVDGQLLWRELWLGSSGSADLWRRQRAFAGSAAAMSIVGHLLGLGDRHLDNVLLRRAAGTLVHIDFSVVFDRGLQLKVPEVVPFRLTQTLVAALGVTGVEGPFRRGCERALAALRANAGPVATLLELALTDPGVDWEAEGGAKAASKAFAHAAALQTFVLRQASTGQALAAAVRAAAAGLAAAAASLGPYAHQFLAAASTAAAAAESHARLQRCQATLDNAAAQEQQLAARVQEGQAALEAMLAESQPLAVELQACLQECQAWQQRHDALLPLLLANPPAVLLVGAAAVEPGAASAAGVGPLLLVSSTDGSGGDGSGSVLHAALGMLPSQAPLSASLLLQADAADKQGARLLQERALAAAQLVAALQQYAAAAACLLGGPSYAGSSQHTHWLAAFQAAMNLPVSQGFERATQLAPRRPEAAEVLARWRPLAAAAAAAVGLEQQWSGAAAALQLERVDLALSAADAKQRAVDAAAERWAAAAAAPAPEAREQGVAALALAFADFSAAQADGVLQLAAQHEAEQAGEAPAGEEAAAATALLERVQRLILGYASVAVATRDATSEALFLAADGSSLLGALSQAVQSADSLSTAAAELQLLLPPLLAVLIAPTAAEQVSAAVSAAAEHLEAAADATLAEEQAAASAMQPLLAAAAQHPPLGALLQGLQRVQAAAQALLPPAEQPSLASEQLQLAGALVGVWQEMEDALAVAAAGADSASPCDDGGAAAWQPCSAVLAAAVAAEAAQHLLPALAAALGGIAQQLRASAPSLAHRAGLEAAAAAPAPAWQQRARFDDLVPFAVSGFADAGMDADLAGAGLLLGSLEEELGLEGGPASGLPQPLRLAAAVAGGAQAGGGAGAEEEPGLVPFLDFDESLGGAEDMLEPLEASAAGFEGLAGASQDQLSQPSEGWDAGEDGGAAPPGVAALAAALAAAAEATGALAAVDAAQYVSALARQQLQAVRQQHCAQLGAYQWVHERLLPAEAATAAEVLLEGAVVSGARAAAAGVPLPAVHPAVGSWELRGSRRQVLQQLQAGVGTLLSLAAPLQQWQQVVAAAAAAMAGEAEAAMPYAAPALHEQLQRQQQWLAVAAAHAGTLVDVSQAVLQFEASRSAALAADAAGEALLAEEAAQPADRYQVEQAEGWQRYAALLRGMQQLQGRYSAAEGGVAGAAGELEQLQLRAAEAASVAQSAAEAGSAAAANFAGLALPLVKATLQLPGSVAKLLPQLAGAGEWAAQLRRGARAAAELAAAGDEGGTEAAAAAAELDAAAARLQLLLPATQALQAALLPVRNRLLAGRRGEAAAQAQAAEVVDSLSAAVTSVAPHLERENVQASLQALPPRLEGLAARAAQQAEQLQTQHGFSLHGLEQLLAAAEVSAAAAPAAALPPAGGTGGAPAAALTGSLLLTVGAAGGAARQQQRREYADSVMRRFSAKLAGREVDAGSGSADAVGADADVAAQVAELVAAATSRANLARMYEGWMPWL